MGRSYTITNNIRNPQLPIYWWWFLYTSWKIRNVVLFCSFPFNKCHLAFCFISIKSLVKINDIRNKKFRMYGKFNFRNLLKLGVKLLVTQTSYRHKYYRQLYDIIVKMSLRWEFIYSFVSIFWRILTELSMFNLGNQ